MLSAVTAVRGRCCGSSEEPLRAVGPGLSTQTAGGSVWWGRSTPERWVEAMLCSGQGAPTTVWQGERAHLQWQFLFWDNLGQRWGGWFFCVCDCCLLQMGPDGF